MGNNVYDIIKEERRKRKLPGIYWSRDMAKLAQSQANYCAKIGRMVHSDRYAFRGGENLAQGGNNFSPGAIVSCWMHSKAGHREYLLSPRLTKAGIGIARKNGKTFAAFAFSDQPPSHPDCPYYKPKPLKIPTLKIPKLRLYIGGKGMLRAPISILVGLLGIWLIILGAHGLYAYFSAELWFGGDSHKLFMTFGVPGKLGDTVLWMSSKSMVSWVIPAAVFVGGWVVMSWSGIWNRISSLLSKLRLW